MASLNCSSKYPEISQLLKDRGLCLQNDSKLSKAIDNDYREVEFIEFFLKHSKSIKNSEKLIDQLMQYGTVTNNFNPEDWHAILAEFAAFYILQYRLGLNITAYEPQVSSDKGNSCPDFSLKIDNELVYFEVKDKCSEVVQQVPNGVNQSFDEIEHRYDDKYLIVITEVNKLKHKNLDKKQNLEIIKKAIEKRLQTIEHYKILERSDRKSSVIEISMESGHVTVSIRKKDNESQKRPRYFTPDEIDDIRSWLLEKKKNSRTGEAMIPMVEQAESKGADYLMARIPFWRNLDTPFYDYVKQFFSDITLIKENFAVSKGNELKNLSGMIIFSSLTDYYIIVSNANVKPKINDWLFNNKF